MPVNPFSQNSEQKTFYERKNLENLKDDRKEEIENKKKERKEMQDLNLTGKETENVSYNPFHYLSLFSKYFFSNSDSHTKFKTSPTIKIVGTMDLLDSTLAEQGKLNYEKILKVRGR